MENKIVNSIFKYYFSYLVLVGTFSHFIPRKISEKRKFFLTQHLLKKKEVKDYVRLIESAEEAFRIRIQLIQSSTYSIYVAYHTFIDGKTTNAFLYELYQAANRGVKVKMILDEKVNFLGKISLLLSILGKHKNIEIRSFNRVNIHEPWNFHALLHDKFMIVDHRFLLLGGRNIGDRYLLNSGKNMVCDRDVLVYRLADYQHSVIGEVFSYMEELWYSKFSERKKLLNLSDDKVAEVVSNMENEYHCFLIQYPTYFSVGIHNYFEEMIQCDEILFLHNPIAPDNSEPWIAYQLSKIMAAAKRRIVIQSPYATANKRFLTFMKELSEKGIEIIYSTNSPALTPNLLAFSNYYYQRRKFLKSGIRIFELQADNPIHGKTILVDDDISVVGSYNMDDRSFFIDTESVLVIKSIEFNRLLKKQITHQCQQSLEVNNDNKYVKKDVVIEKRPARIKRMALYISSVFSRIFQHLI